MIKLVALIATIAASVHASPSGPVNASCTVSSYDDVASAVSSCTTLTLKDITVPAETTLELKLQTGTKLTLEGTFKWEYAEWKGPLMEISGSKVTVTGSSVTLDGRGENNFSFKSVNLTGSHLSEHPSVPQRMYTAMLLEPPLMLPVTSFNTKLVMGMLPFGDPVDEP
ncbi:hypothetical protein YQE_08964, partial [Dendroctonus ponderosae]